MILKFFKQIYIFGGIVYNASADRVEVMDTDLSTISPLLGSDGLPMKLSSLINIRMVCVVGLDDSNEIVISGGNLTGTG